MTIDSQPPPAPDDYSVASTLTSPLTLSVIQEPGINGSSAILESTDNDGSLKEKDALIMEKDFDKLGEGRLLDAEIDKVPVDDPEARAHEEEEIEEEQEVEMEIIDSPLSYEGLPGQNPYSPDPLFYDALCRNDVYLTLRFLAAMCNSMDGKLSMSSSISESMTSELPQSSDQVSPLATRARLLGLELLVSIFTNAGPSLSSKSNIQVLLIMKQYVVIAISRNAMVLNPILFELSVSLFLLILRLYLHVLKKEIEVLLHSIYLHILEMENSTYKQKSVVLQALLKIAESPQLLVDLFINYDCDFATASIFERIVSACVKLAQGKNSSSTLPAGFMSLAASATGLDSKNELAKLQEQRLRLRSLCVLVAIISSLVDWSKDMTPDIPFFRNLFSPQESPPGQTQDLTLESTPVVLNKRPLNHISMTSVSLYLIIKLENVRFV